MLLLIVNVIFLILFRLSPFSFFAHLRNCDNTSHSFKRLHICKISPSTNKRGYNIKVRYTEKTPSKSRGYCLVILGRVIVFVNILFQNISPLDNFKKYNRIPSFL